jgi:DNA repair protein RecO (recombination protein O)
MGLGRSAAVVIGSVPLGESDRIVSFFSRDFGRVRGVARAARRIRSRFGGALELFTLGQLVFFDTGRSDLVRIDHFDVTHPFAALRENLGTLGEAAWVVEVVARTTGEHDRQPGLYGLLVRTLHAMEATTRPARVAVCFGVRCLTSSVTARAWTDVSSAAGSTRSPGRPSPTGVSSATAVGPASTRCPWLRPRSRPSPDCVAYAGRRRSPRRWGARGPSCGRSWTRICRA